MRGAHRVWLVAAAAAVSMVAADNTSAQDSAIMSAMADELARSMKELRLKDEPAPYYIEYEVEDRISTRITARLGALVEDLNGRGRTLRVAVRVGDYAFDSSLFVAPGTGGAGVVQLSGDGSTTAPLDSDYHAMRRQMWLATDTAYKRAVSIFARKKAAFQNRASAAAIPDFSREEPARTELEAVAPTLVNRAWPERAKTISAVFAAIPEIELGDVTVADTRGTRYYINSEGARTVAPIEVASIRGYAATRADDGTAVQDVFTVVEKALDDMPPVSDLVARARTMAERLTRTRMAAVGEEFTGPVLVEGEGAATLVADALVPAMLGRRPPEIVGRGGRTGGPGQVTPFHRRIGLRVLTEPFTVVDTPSLERFDGRPVAGAYEVDDYGLRPKDVTLVEKGRLVTLLTGRAPLRGLPQSSGHTRGGDVQPGVFQVQSDEALPASELRTRYLQLLRTQDQPHGYIIRRIGSADDLPGGGGLLLDVVRVTPDGEEQPVRGLRLGSVPPAIFRDLLDASRERTLYSYRTTSTDAATVIVPNLIFEELELVQGREIVQKPPIVPRP